MQTIHDPGAAAGTQYPFLLTGAPHYEPKIGTWNDIKNASTAVAIMNIIASTIDKVMRGGK